MKSETYFSREAIENYHDKVLNENSIVGGSWSPSKLFIMQNHTDRANWDVLLTVENV